MLPRRALVLLPSAALLLTGCLGVPDPAPQGAEEAPDPAPTSSEVSEGRLEAELLTVRDIPVAGWRLDEQSGGGVSTDHSASDPCAAAMQEAGVDRAAVEDAPTAGRRFVDGSGFIVQSIAYLPDAPTVVTTMGELWAECSGTSGGTEIEITPTSLEPEGVEAASCGVLTVAAGYRKLGGHYCYVAPTPDRVMMVMHAEPSRSAPGGASASPGSSEDFTRILQAAADKVG